MKNRLNAVMREQNIHYHGHPKHTHTVARQPQRDYFLPHDPYNILTASSNWIEYIQTRLKIVLK
jgi:hypothetical protein